MKEQRTGLTKINMEDKTVGGLREALKDIPDNWEFLNCGVNDYAILLDNDFGMVSIDKEDFIDEVINENKNRFLDTSNGEIDLRKDYAKETWDEVELRIERKGKTIIYKGLFNDMRIKKETIPDNFVVYELAGDDDTCGDPVRISKSVLVNFIGTLLFECKLPLNKMGCLWIDGEKVKIDIGY